MVTNVEIWLGNNEGNFHLHMFAASENIAKVLGDYLLNSQYRKGANCEALQLEGRTTLCLDSGHFVLRIRTHCCFAAYDQNSDIAIRFSNPDFIKHSNNLAIRRRIHAMTTGPKLTVTMKRK